MSKHIAYNYLPITTCNMCGALEKDFIFLGKRLNSSQGLFPNEKNGILTTVVQCGKCGLVFSNPQPIPGNIQDHYGVPPESYWKEDYFEVSEDYFRGEINWFKKLVDFKPGMKSLDVGAGIGKQMISLERAGFDAYGFEPGTEFYKRAISKMNISKDKVLNKTIEEVEYEDNSFDFISFGVVLEHIYDPHNALVKALKWLKPGGLIHIEVPHAKWLISKLINLSYKARGMDYVTHLSPMHNPYHLYEFTLKSFVINGTKAGYKVKDHTVYVCKTFMPKILDPLLKNIMKRTDTGMQLCVWLEKNKPS